MTQTTQGVLPEDVARLRTLLLSSSHVDVHPIDVAVVDRTTAIPRDLLTDPWDRFIVATATKLALPLVTRDERIRSASLVETIW